MNKIIVISIVLLITGSIFVACNDKVNNDPGILSVHVVLPDGSPAVNAKLSIATSEYNLKKGDFYIEDASSDLNGLIEIQDLPPRTYYYECVTINYNKDNYFSSGSAIVLPGAKEDVNVKLEKM